MFLVPIDEMGSRSSLSRDNTSELDHWEMNYHEAAIFLEVQKSIISLHLIAIKLNNENRFHVGR